MKRGGCKFGDGNFVQAGLKFHSWYPSSKSQCPPPPPQAVSRSRGQTELIRAAQRAILTAHREISEGGETLNYSCFLNHLYSYVRPPDPPFFSWGRGCIFIHFFYKVSGKRSEQCEPFCKISFKTVCFALYIFPRN